MPQFSTRLEPCVSPWGWPDSLVQNITFNQTNMFQSCSQIQDWIGREGCYLVCNPSKLSIASYFNNMRPTKHIHLVYLVHCGPNVNHLMIDEVSNSCKVIKKICPLTKKISMPMQTFCWSWTSSQGTFTKLWGLCWPVSLTVLPLSLGTKLPQIL